MRLDEGTDHADGILLSVGFFVLANGLNEEGDPDLAVDVNFVNYQKQKVDGSYENLSDPVEIALILTRI